MRILLLISMLLMSVNLHGQRYEHVFSVIGFTVGTDSVIPNQDYERFVSEVRPYLHENLKYLDNITITK